MYLLKKSNGQLLGSEIFWLSSVWGLCIGTSLLGGVKYSVYGFSWHFFVFFCPCVLAFITGRQKGLRTHVAVFSSFDISHVVSYKFLLLGLLGAFLYLYDCFRLNGLYTLLFEEGGRKTIQLSMLGIIGALLLPLTLLQGLSLFARELLYNRIFSFKSFLVLLAYALPSTITGGRESLLYCIIGMLSIYGFRLLKRSKEQPIQYKSTRKQKKWKHYFLLVGCISLVSWLVYEISTKRFSANDVNYFLYINDVSQDVQDDAELWGKFSFIYYNILSYFGHQISFLDFTIKHYEGPYLFGFFEFNIFARRLGIDYLVVFENIGKLQSQYGMTALQGTWNTILGSFICDFGRLGSIPICFLCGYLIGIVRKKINKTMDVRYAILVSLLSISAFSTVQLGPFYQTMIWSTYFWWYIINHKFETKII